MLGMVGCKAANSPRFNSIIFGENIDRHHEEKQTQLDATKEHRLGIDAET